MATTRIIPMHLNKGKTLAQCLADRTEYGMNPDKTDGGELISSFACEPETVVSEFALSKREYRELTGRVQESDIIAYQIRQSFKPGEVSPEEANRIGYEFAERFLKGNHAFIVCTHTAPLRTAEAQKVQRQLDKKRSEHERLQKLLMSLYENLADGIIDRDEYARLKQNYSGRAAECEKQMDALQESLVQIKEHGGEHREWMTQFRKHQNITELERSIAVALIDRILIYKDNRVEVHFRFEDEFAWQMDILRRSQIREVV